ncbi:MAG: DoxX family membrane protein [Shimia sp.]
MTGRVARWIWVAARLLYAQLFVLGALQKLVDPGPVQGLLSGVLLPPLLVWPIAAFNAALGLAIVAGWRLVPVCLVAAAYCTATSVFHLIPSDPWQMTIFVKNWALAGGGLALAVAAGRPTST